MRPATAVTPSRWFTGNPEGQCAVSSVWLAEEVALEYSIASTFCQGSLIFDGNQAVDLLDHCWLEIPAAPEELVLDLSCDQAREFDREIVFDLTSDLGRARIYYVSRDRVSISVFPQPGLAGVSVASPQPSPLDALLARCQHPQSAPSRPIRRLSQLIWASRWWLSPPS
jgi:hypothetical protein